jgi:hypothetical protein
MRAGRPQASNLPRPDPRPRRPRRASHPILEEVRMKKLLIAASAASLFAASYAVAEVRDWHDLERVRRHILESIHEMERARAANHYDMQGHGVKAEQLLRDAEKELHEAVEAAKTSK